MRSKRGTDFLDADGLGGNARCAGGSDVTQMPNAARGGFVASAMDVEAPVVRWLDNSIRVNRDFGDVVRWIEAGEKREVGATSGFFL